MLNLNLISRQKLILILGFFAGVSLGVIGYRVFIEKPCPECPPTSVVKIGKQKNKGSGSITSTISQTPLTSVFLNDSLIAVKYIQSLSKKDWRKFRGGVR